nr:hypothetical protein [Tanacetum cinerariifolium]
MANVYPNVHGSLKFPADEHVILEEPLSSSGTLSSMKNLDDAYTIRDQFLNVKPTEYEPALHEALEASIKRANRDEFLAEKDKSCKRCRYDQDPPPPPPDLDLSKKRRHYSGASGKKLASHHEQPIKDVPIIDNVNVLDSVDTDTAHLPKLKTRPEWMKPVPEEDKPATPEPDWVIPPNELLEHENNLANDLEYLVSGDKGRRSALSISKLKATHYLDFGLEELVLSLWIESEREYDISVAYGISHWSFKRKEFYITRHDAPSDHSKVRSHMRILSVISLKTYERCRYTFLKEIVLRRADYKEYKISEADFRNLHPNDFEDLYLLHLQGQLNHLSRDDKVHLFNAVNLWIRKIIIRKRVEDMQLEIKSYQTKLNLTQPDWDASFFSKKTTP